MEEYEEFVYLNVEDDGGEEDVEGEDVEDVEEDDDEEFMIVFEFLKCSRGRLKGLINKWKVLVEDGDIDLD